jgi:hypothetical protein
MYEYHPGSCFFLGVHILKVTHDPTGKFSQRGVVIVVRRKPPAAQPPEPEEPISEQEEPLQEPKEAIPLEILKSRYQRGEITEEEYKRLRLALESD